MSKEYQMQDLPPLGPPPSHSHVSHDLESQSQPPAYISPSSRPHLTPSDSKSYLPPSVAPSVYTLSAPLLPSQPISKPIIYSYTNGLPQAATLKGRMIGRGKLLGLYLVSFIVLGGAAAVIWVLVRNNKEKNEKKDAAGSGHGG